MKEIKIQTDFIKLGQFLKFAGIILNGAEAKIFLETNKVFVNDEPENRRGKKLIKNDIVKINNEVYKIC